MHHQYQQNKQLPLILTELTEHKKTTTYDVGNPGSGLGQVHKFGGVKQVYGIPSWYMDLQRQYVYKKPRTYSLSLNWCYIYQLKLP